MSKTNVERLVEAHVLDDSELTQAGIDAINELDLSDEEIATFKRFKDELGLDPLKLTDPIYSGGISGMGSL